MQTMRRAALGLGCLAVILATGGARADTALLIGNAVYEPKCHPGVPSVPGDVAQMSVALTNAMYTVHSVADRNGIEMMTDLESNLPPAPDRYVVYYTGYGEPLVAGELVGPDCTRMGADDVVGILFDDVARTLLILDSCASGAFADAANALDSRICTITSTTGTDCGTAGVFTPCFVAGLNGAADSNGNGMVTVAEAAAYAIANCGDGTTTPTWDGDCGDVVLGTGTVSVEAGTWGRTKAAYR